VFKADVPLLAKEKGMSLEACAREVRYAFFRKEAARLGVSALLVAHSSSDQAETVLLHLLRGSGLRGLCGISPWRNGIARPLLCLSAEEIRTALEDAGIPFVLDSTNFETDATRNYLRHEILPKLERVVSDPTRAICRAAENLQGDREVLEEEAARLRERAMCEDTLLRSVLQKAPRAIVARVLASYLEERLPLSQYPEKVHLEQIMDLLSSDRPNFFLDLPGGARMYCDRDRIGIAPEERAAAEFSVSLKFGENVLPDGGILYIGDENTKDTDKTKNIYKLFIQAKLSSATIENGCVARSRRPSDSYRVGGHRHSVKKLLNEAKVPLLLRGRLPILEDGDGIAWIPFLKTRDGEGKTNPISVSYFIKK
jgi:tRNA(Ile)-lysidine synthase